MWKEQAIVLNEKQQIMYFGRENLQYIRLSTTKPFAYPAGRLENGDVLVYFCRGEEEADADLHRLTAMDCGINGKQAVMELRARQEDAVLENFLAVGAIGGDSAGIVKTNRPLQQTGVLLDTLFARHEVTVRLGEGELIFLLNGQKLLWPLAGMRRAAAVVCSEGIRYFDAEYSGAQCGDAARSMPGEQVSFLPETAETAEESAEAGEDEERIAQVLKTGRFPAMLREERIYGRSIEQIMTPPAFQAMMPLAAEGGEAAFSHRGKRVSVRAEKVELAEQTLLVYMLGDADTLCHALHAQEEVYRSLLEHSGSYAPEGKAEIELSGFHLAGEEEQMRALESLLQKGSQTNTTMLLTGERGTGKTYLARQIHKNSRRSQGPFISVNCASIPGRFFDSELFGEEGRETADLQGQDTGKPGYLERANGGSLFLDEIAQMPLTTQEKLYEALSMRTFCREGGQIRRPLDVRLIAATNQDLKRLVREKKFQEDLYYRLDVFTVEIPPLRQRLSGLYSIICDILPEICSRLGVEPLVVSSQAMEKMMRYSWPGNLRELENLLEKAAILSDRRVIMPENVWLPEEEKPAEPEVQTEGRTLKEIREACEKQAIVRALEEFDGDKGKAAKALGIGRTDIFDKIKRYNIDSKETDENDPE